MIPIQATDGELVSLYSKVLNDEIDNYWNNSNQELLKEQSDFYNKFYSWDVRKNEWNTLFDKLSNS
jgi:hypothetical protein